MNSLQKLFTTIVVKKLIKEKLSKHKIFLIIHH